MCTILAFPSLCQEEKKEKKRFIRVAQGKVIIFIISVTSVQAVQHVQAKN